MSKHIGRLIGLVVIVVLIVLIRQQAGQAGGESEEEANPIMLFILYVILAVVVGLLLIGTVLPALAERIGDFFYAPAEEAPPSSKGKATALVAQGEYDAAIDAFRELARETPEDRTPFIEIARIYADKLANPQGAVATLEQALASENHSWSEDDIATFKNRLVDLALEPMGDYERARALLHEISSEFPDTRHAANATHRLREVDEAEFKATRENA